MEHESFEIIDPLRLLSDEKENGFRDFCAVESCWRVILSELLPRKVGAEVNLDFKARVPETVSILTCLEFLLSNFELESVSSWSLSFLEDLLVSWDSDVFRKKSFAYINT